MKKILMLFIATVCLVACSKGDEPNEQPEMSKEVRELWTTLNGKILYDSRSCKYRIGLVRLKQSLSNRTRN